MPARFRSAHRTTAVLIAISASCAVIAAFCLPGAPIARADDCGAGAVVIVGGTNDPDAANMIGVKQRFTGTGIDGELGTDDDSDYADAPYVVVRTDYPTTLWPLGAAGYDDSVAQGNAATKQAIARYQHDCPGNPVVVAGYSQGARVAGDVLSDIGNDRDDKVVLLDEHGNPELDDEGEPIVVDISTDDLSGELYTDPRRVGDKTGRGLELSLIGVIPGLTMTGAREGDGNRGFGELEDSVVSVCVEGDPICDLPDPLYDPIGTVDGLVGYFTKHGLYNWQMYRDPSEPVWNTGRVVDCGADQTDCIAEADSAIIGVIRDGAETIGLDGTRIRDVLADRWTVDLPYGIELSNLQPAVRLVQDVLPPLPNLGYGGYLADLLVFEKILNGVVDRAPDDVKEGVAALAASAKSIVLIPANFVKYWAGEIIGLLPTRSTVVGPHVPEGSDEDAPRRVTFLRAMSQVTDIESEAVGTESKTPSEPGAVSAAASTADSGTESSPSTTSPSATPPSPPTAAAGTSTTTSVRPTPTSPSTTADTSPPSSPTTPPASSSGTSSSTAEVPAPIETDTTDPDAPTEENTDPDDDGEGDSGTEPGPATVTGAGSGSGSSKVGTSDGDNPEDDE
ncbi:cutinase family protein [Gordonia mangrovi]|uniref:cutinase family protein n=1 Tax=Gordonia mangrovi TaxID=2665643 RepID=UPI001925D36A|nr:PE-PPE domain-containing protein [Gordonia mangrovi]UVF77358.1 PE-PPE domain-containing protein [Gordonia mangrovi]